MKHLMKKVQDNSSLLLVHLLTLRAQVETLAEYLTRNASAKEKDEFDRTFHENSEKLIREYQKYTTGTSENETSEDEEIPSI